MATTAASRLPKGLAERMKDAVLGRRYELSVAYVTRTAMRALNRTYRSKDVATDILSFPLTKSSGEMILCLPEVGTHARAFGTNARAYLPYLFIHGLVHLKGHAHGRIMTELERSYCRRFDVQHPTPQNHGATNRSRNRRRNVPGTRRRLPLGR